MSFIFLVMLMIFFFKVYSIFYLVLFFEMLSLMSSIIFMFFLNAKMLMFYVFLTFLVIEAVVNFSLLVIFSRKIGNDLFLKN